MLKIRSEIDAILMKSAVRRASYLSLVLAFAYSLYGFSIFGFLKNLDPEANLFNNAIPRVLFSGIPSLLLFWLLRSKVRINILIWVWIIAWPLILVASCMTRVWPAIYSGNSELYLYFHGANMVAISVPLVFIGLSPIYLVINIIWLLIGFFCPIILMLSRNSSHGILMMFINDLVAILSMSFFLAYLNYLLRRRLAERDMEVISYQRNELFIRDLEIRRKTEDVVKLKLSALIGDSVAQIAHDIRSPIAALNVILSEMQDLDKDRKEMLSSAIDRINHISKTLLKNQNEIRKNSGLSEDIIDDECLVLLQLVVSKVIAEKQIQFKDKQNLAISFEASKSNYDVFIAGDSYEIARVLSNLINNSVEAIDHSGSIKVEIGLEGDQVAITVVDTGKGIPSHLLSKLGKQGATFHKENGSGLGLFHAKSYCEKWKGRMDIISHVDIGTKVLLSFPIQLAPYWFLRRLFVNKNKQVVALTSDPSICLDLKKRFEGAGKVDNIIFISSLSEFDSWTENKIEGQDTIYLISSDFGDKALDGITVAERYNLGDQAILLTDAIDDKILREKCVRLGIKILPLAFIGIVPIGGMFEMY